MCEALVFGPGIALLSPGIPIAFVLGLGLRRRPGDVWSLTRWHVLLANLLPLVGAASLAATVYLLATRSRSHARR
ncbi:MAG: hypothetical protein ACREPI_01505 [Candidatus Dormibacterales bacterium]